MFTLTQGSIATERDGVCENLDKNIFSDCISSEERNYQGQNIPFETTNDLTKSDKLHLFNEGRVIQ